MAQKGNITVNGLSIPVWDMQSTAQQIDDTVAAVMEWQEDQNNPGCYYHMVDGIQEWFNPPMELGIEYRTTERQNKQPVYTMLVNGGTFPSNGSTILSIQIPNYTGGASLVDCYGRLSNGSRIPGGFGESVPALDSMLQIFSQNATTGIFTVGVGANRTVGLQFTLTLKYTRSDS